MGISSADVRDAVKRRRGFALLVALSLVALGMGAAFVMLHSSDLGVRSSVRDDLDARSTRAAESGLQLGIDVLRRRTWAGVGTQFTGTWLDGTSYRVRYIAGDASLVPGAAEYAYLPYRVTVEATATVADPSDQTAASTRTASAVLELFPKRLQTPLAGWGQREDYALFQFKRAGKTGEPMLEAPFQFDGKVRLSEPVKEWCKEHFADDARRQPYLSGLRTMALAGTDRRPFTSRLEYKVSDQPAAFKTDVASRLGLTVTDAAGVTQLASPGSAATSYRLYQGGPTYSIPSFSSTYGSSADHFTTTADPTTNPLGIWRMTTSITLKNDSHVNGMLLATTSASSLTVDGDRVSMTPPKAMSLNSRTLGLALQSVCVTDKLTFKKSAGDVAFRGTVGVWDLCEFEEDDDGKSILIEGGLQCHSITIKAQKNFKDFPSWSAALSAWNAHVAGGGTTPFPMWLETNHGLPSTPTLKIRKDVTGAGSTFLFDPTRSLYDYDDATSGNSWRLVRMTPPT